MSELIQKHDNRAAIRWKLLTGASALALTAYISSAGVARAEDASQPQVWIELGGQLSHLQDGQETFAPSIFDNRPSIFSPSQKFERPPLYGIDEFGGLSFRSEDSNWIFSASIRYGRSSSNRHVHQQTYPETHVIHFSISGVPYQTAFEPDAARFADTNAQNSERHAILDFQAGKDVGLGLFGSKNGESTLSLGVRFAQFVSKSNIALKSDPDWHFAYEYLPSSVVSAVHATNSKFVYGQAYHTNIASMRAKRSFHGIGPSISWNASTPVAGNPQNGQLEVDWGLNAALLFGRQRTRVHHQTTGQYHTVFSYNTLAPRIITYQPAPVNRTRSRPVTVPNVGGFAGISFRYDDAKVSFGYRADMFFGAIDGGIDTRKNENRGFFGPYASISIGLGD